MRTLKTCLVVAVIMCMGAVAGAADNKTVPPVTWNTTMPSIELSNQPLEKVLNELKVKLPGFNFSISRENVPHDYPVLPTMTLENVSLGQFITIVQQQIPGVQIQSSDEAGNSIFSGNSMAAGQKGDGPFCAVYVKPSSSAGEAEVHVFGLAEIIAYRASLIPGDGDHTKQASDDVLSLIQASLDEQNISPKAEMKLHPATQVLICRITPAQEELIKQVVQALQPSDGEQRRLSDEQKQKDQAIALIKEQLEEVGQQSNSPQALQLRERLKRLTQQPLTQPTTQPQK